MTGVTEGRPVVHPRLAPRRGAARATTWWGKAWVRAVEEAGFTETDLRAGRTLARSGTVGGITLAEGSAVAAIEDDRDLWTVSIGVPVLDANMAEALVEVVAAEAGRIGALLGGDLPHSLVEHAEEAGVELLPFGGEFETSCTCDGWLDPCPHALAVLYQLTWLLEADPFVLLLLRGQARDGLLARLHSRVGTSDPDPDDRDGATLDAASDAVLRAARVLELLEADDGRPIDHLF